MRNDIAERDWSVFFHPERITDKDMSPRRAERGTYQGNVSEAAIMSTAFSFPLDTEGITASMSISSSLSMIPGRFSSSEPKDSCNERDQTTMTRRDAPFRLHNRTYVLVMYMDILPRTGHQQKIKVSTHRADIFSLHYNNGSYFCRRLHRLVRWIDKRIRKDADFRQNVGSLFSDVVTICI